MNSSSLTVSEASSLVRKLSQRTPMGKQRLLEKWGLGGREFNQDYWLQSATNQVEYEPEVIKKAYKPLIEIIAQSLQEGSTILDVGCGDGSLIKYLGDNGYKVEGLDINPIAVALARRNQVNASLMPKEGISGNYNLILMHRVAEEPVMSNYEANQLVKSACSHSDLVIVSTKIGLIPVNDFSKYAKVEVLREGPGYENQQIGRVVRLSTI